MEQEQLIMIRLLQDIVIHLLFLSLSNKNYKESKQLSHKEIRLNLKVLIINKNLLI